jgi:histidyl-tRNA synthetase
MAALRVARRFFASAPVEARQSVRGMRDIMGADVVHFEAVERIMRQTAMAHEYHEIRTPVLEPLKVRARAAARDVCGRHERAPQVFTHSLGDGSDVVMRQMFVLDADDESKAAVLRPENTAGAPAGPGRTSARARPALTLGPRCAGVVRALVQARAFNNQSHRVFYCGPMFRWGRALAKHSAS